jgi:integrase family protein with SAM-like domain
MISITPTSSFVSEAEISAAAFLSRYSGRTLEAYRLDLRTFFQCATDVDVEVLHATRAHIELYRTSLEDRRLAAATIDRRLSTVCGFFRFAHIDGRIGENPAQYVRRPTVHPNDIAGMDRAALARSCSPLKLRSRARRARGPPRTERSTSVRGMRDQHRRPRVRTRAPHPSHRRQGQQTRRHPTRTANCTHNRSGHR